MPDLGIHEQRRYSALLFTHPSIRELSDLKRALGKNIGSSKHVRLGVDKWSAQRFEYLVDHSLYPPHLQAPEAQKRKDGYAHYLYWASRKTRGSRNETLNLIASPYVRLLLQLFRRLRSDEVPAPAIRYAAIDMPLVYDDFMNGVSDMTAVKVTMQMLNEPTLELVSLAGKNPLRSDLHAAITDVAAPYSLRANVATDQGRTRVNADRHGNLWWYQTDETKIGNALRFIDVLDAWGALNLVRSLPLDRAEDVDEE